MPTPSTTDSCWAGLLLRRAAAAAAGCGQYGGMAVATGGGSGDGGGLGQAPCEELVKRDLAVACVVLLHLVECLPPGWALAAVRPCHSHHGMCEARRGADTAPRSAGATKGDEESTARERPPLQCAQRWPHWRTAHPLLCGTWSGRGSDLNPPPPPPSRLAARHHTVLLYPTLPSLPTLWLAGWPARPPAWSPQVDRTWQASSAVNFRPSLPQKSTTSLPRQCGGKWLGNGDSKTVRGGAIGNGSRLRLCTCGARSKERLARQKAVPRWTHDSSRKPESSTSYA